MILSAKGTSLARLLHLMKRSNYLFQSFFKPEHTILNILIYLGRSIRVVWIRMMAIEKLNNMKPTAIHIKVDVPFFKIWCYRLP